MKQLITITLLLISCWAFSQKTVYHKYWVFLSDKDNTPYSLNYPEEFLSKKAIERRERQDIPLHITDLPVDPYYADSVAAMVTAVNGSSKWFNALEISETDTAVITKLRALEFVVDIQPVAALTIEEVDDNRSVVYSYQLEQDYGFSFNQINQVEGDYLHELGYRGAGMTIAVMDAGFQSVNVLPAFDSLFLKGRVLGTWDYVDNQENVYHRGTHGRNVLSIMAGNMPGVYIGTAPEANYYLFRTEDGGSEYRVEEGNWVRAIERADSLGVDLVNSSLGYSVFNDSTMNYTYADMTGTKALISRAAEYASDKGILVVTSAGNEGNSNWRYITAPGDARDILTVGAADSAGLHASFSSYGPTADGRIKPDVVGRGRLTVYAGDDGNIYAGNGTSYSAPLVAGLTACLWQSNYDKTNLELIRAMRRSASTYDFPTDSMGFGLANFRSAHFLLVDNEQSPYDRAELPAAYPNPFTTGLSVMVFARNPGTFELEVYSSFGNRVYAEERQVVVGRYSRFDLSAIDDQPAGMYIVRVKFDDEIKQVKVIKL